MFPDGYTSTNEYNEERGFTIESVSKNQYTGYSYIKTTGVDSTALPFQDAGAVDNNVDRDFGTRNNVLNPVSIDPVETPYPVVTDAAMEWFRLGQKFAGELDNPFRPPPAAASLFHESSNGDMRLRHIPADVCLNASPEDGSYGSPIRTVHRFKGFHELGTEENDHIKNAVGAQISCEYIERNYGEGDNRTGSSAFDFQPTNPARAGLRSKPRAPRGFAG